MRVDLLRHFLHLSNGHVDFAGTAVPQAPLRYKYLEIIRNMDLVRNKENYKAKVCFDVHARGMIAW